MTGANGKLVRSQCELEIYRRARDAAMLIFEQSKLFPREEAYSLTDQLRRSSRSVTANLTEAWRKRRYPASWIAKLTDAEAEAAETQHWVEYAVRCGYLKRADGAAHFKTYESLISSIVGMELNWKKWTLPPLAAR
jgi:four helix bundle protein